MSTKMSTESTSFPFCYGHVVNGAVLEAIDH